MPFFLQLPVEHPLFLSIIRQVRSPLKEKTPNPYQQHTSAKLIPPFQARDATADRATDLAQQYYAQ
jgi:hypothetical protein